MNTKSFWFVADKNGNLDIGRGDTEIAKVYSGRDDARLMAAAPELLSALLDLVACVSFHGPAGTTAYIISDERMNAAREAISRATKEAT